MSANKYTNIIFKITGKIGIIKVLSYPPPTLSFVLLSYIIVCK